MRNSVLARIPGFRERIIPEPHVPSRGSQARGTRLIVLHFGRFVTSPLHRTFVVLRYSTVSFVIWSKTSLIRVCEKSEAKMAAIDVQYL